MCFRIGKRTSPQPLECCQSLPTRQVKSLVHATLKREALLHLPRNIIQDEETELPPLLVGMDVLSQMHVYIAYKEGMVYVTPASAAQ